MLAPVVRNTDRIAVRDLSRPEYLSDLIREVAKEPSQALLLDFSNFEGPLYPNVAVTLSALLQKLSNNGYHLRWVPPLTKGFVQRSLFYKPLLASAKNIKSAQSLLSTVWMLTDDEHINKFIAAMITDVMGSVECERGVIDALDWAVSEALDNVRLHSESSAAFAMVQVHTQNSPRIAVGIADQGIGIFASLRQSEHKPLKPADALTLATTRGITRDKQIGAGNGLAGITGILRQNKGMLFIKSSGARLRLNDHGDVDVESGLPMLSQEYPGTTVDFQVNAASSIDIGEAIGLDQPNQVFLSSIEDSTAFGDEAYVIAILKDGRGTGTRQAGKLLTNQVKTLLRQGKRVVIDFKGIPMASMSFIDESVARLFAELGFYVFHNLISIRNANTLIIQSIDKTIAQRIMEKERNS